MESRRDKNSKEMHIYTETRPLLLIFREIFQDRPQCSYNPEKKKKKGMYAMKSPWLNIRHQIFR